MATDGLWDNVFIPEMERKIKENPSDVVLLAEKLAKIASVNGFKKNGLSPFAMEAAKHGFAYFGGKLDDVTVVVSKIINA